MKESARYRVNKGNISDIGIGGYGGITSDVTELKNVKVTLGQETLKKDFSGKDIGYLVVAIKNITGYSVVGVIGNNNISYSNFILDFENNLLLKRK